MKGFIKTLSLPLVVVLGLFFVFIVLVFKNLQYPLLWNDEADTAVFAKQVLEYGYPKVHDSKNILMHFQTIDTSTPIKEPYDAYIGNTWIQYYIAAPFVLLSQSVTDLYVKTGLIRLPFAVLGVIGVFLCGLIAKVIFPKKDRSFFIFFSLFILLEILSVSTLLHFRQARAHSINLFLSSFTLLVFVYWKFEKLRSRKIYTSLIAVLLLLLFNTFHISYFIFAGYFFLVEGYTEFRKSGFNRSMFMLPFKNPTLQAVMISLVIVVPEFFFYEMLYVSSQTALSFHYDVRSYLIGFVHALYFFLFYEYLFLFVISRIIVELLIKTEGTIDSDNHKNIFSRYILVFSFVYIAVSLMNPSFYVRYYLPVLPLFVVGMLIDCFVICRFYRKKHFTFYTPETFWFVVFILATIPLLFAKLLYLKEYMFEITHQYVGVLDTVVPYIKENYVASENLIIATNYEEKSLIFYLGSKVLVGYHGYTLEHDREEVPDIIIPRKGWPNNYLQDVYSFTTKAQYLGKRFEIYDYPVNNIPQLVFPPHHLFRTLYAQKDEDKVILYERKHDE